MPATTRLLPRKIQQERSCRPQLKRHKWTIQEMTALCLLDEFFSLSVTNIVLILSAYFPQSACGFNANMVSARLHNIKRGDCLHEAHLVWKSLSTKTRAKLCQSHQDILHSLAQVAHRLQIPLGQTEGIQGNRRRNQKIIQRQDLKPKHDPDFEIMPGT